ncbi:alpha/beta fold hydrolase [Rossellomorea vietnamensis]|uniref:Alpha/beta fold hydrolase n=1 Tax=Rossellomorea vietnamensis TaxID=218284 RepID=A0ACD4CC53_9BACI|nr:alpha/beta fold hydrolase [Rossellomorea vietnamensis]UXH46188.1 alpha/beta fold hydrolase [Rossellomorea vietnamensis]
MFSTNLNGTFNLWAMDLPHLFPYRLTTINQNSSLIHIHQNQIIATFEKDGDENQQLHHMPISGGTPIPFHEEESGSTCYHACFTDQEMYYSTNHENPLLNIYKTDLQTGHTTLIQNGEHVPIVVAAASSDGSYVFTETYSNTHATAFYQSGGSKVPLVPDVHTAHTIKDICLTKEFIYFTTNYGKEFSYLASFNLSTYEFQPLFTLDKEEITSIRFHQQSNKIVIIAEKGVRDHLYIYDLSSDEGERIDTPCDVIKKIVVTKNGNLYVLGISADKTDTIFKRETNGCWTQVTNTKVLGVPEGNMIKPDIVHYESHDGLEIEALLYKPENPNGITILWPHGGPQKAERMIYRPVLQYLVQSGYTLFAPNFRGSKCYGATFEKMVEQNWGEGPRHDCVAGMEWLIQEEFAEKGKIVAMGGSYGGYMSLLLAGRHPEYFCGIVDIFGISNLLTFLNNVPASWRTLMDQMVGNPETDYEKLVRDSPITYIDHMNSPMFIIHGENDPRVKTEESERIIEHLNQRGIDVNYLTFNDEGHGFSKKQNEMKACREIRGFLDRITIDSSSTMSNR